MTKSSCAWPRDNPQMIKYHDTEWGVPIHDDRKLFEFILLDAFQAGLSWEIILKKRDNFRRALHNFDPKKISKYTQDDIDRLLLNEGIIRNRLKLQAAITNAQAFLAVQKEFGSFDLYIWQFVGGKPKVNQWKTMKRDPRSIERVRRHERGPEKAWVQVCRFHHLLCLHASRRDGE